jgi:hypothetical protein
MPVNTDKQCIKILVMENGNLREIVEELLKLLGNRRVPKGSAILLYSAAFMAEVGIVAYVEDFLAVKAMLHEKIGKATRVLPLPPILLGGCDKPDAIRGLYELMAWSDDYFSDEDGYLEATTALARELFNDQGSGSKQEKEFRRVLLPDKAATSGKKAWNSGGYYSPALPTIIRAMTTSMEKRWVTSLISEIRTKLALDLDPNPTLERGMGLQSRANRKVDFLVVGGSNAARLTRMLNDAGYTVCSIIDTTWRITNNSCEALAATIANQIQLEDPGAIVLQLLDNSYYYTKGSDGSRTLPVREQDGKFHVMGDLVLCSAETQIDHLQALTPVLDAAGRRPCLIVSPLPRFVIGGCCQDVRHCANRMDPNFRADQQRQLDGAIRRIKNYLYNCNRRTMRVMDSTFDLRNMPNEDIWCVDPVHPIDPVYRRVAAGVIKMAATLRDNETRGDKRRRADSWETSQPQQQKPRESQYSRSGEPSRDLRDALEDRAGSSGRQYGRGRGSYQGGRAYRGRQLGGQRY